MGGRQGANPDFGARVPDEVVLLNVDIAPVGDFHLADEVGGDREGRVVLKVQPQGGVAEGLHVGVLPVVDGRAFLGVRLLLGEGLYVLRRQLDLPSNACEVGTGIRV